MLNLTTALAAIVVGYFLLWALLYCSQDAKEPPAVATEVPFISPVVGLVTRKLSYFVFLRDKHQLPIYTLRLPGTRIYVVKSTALIPAVQQSARTLSWSPIVIKVATNVMALSKSTVRVIEEDLKTNGNFLTGLHKAMHLGLSPGTAALDKLSRNAVTVFATSLDSVAASGKPFSVPMYQWLGHEVLLTITGAIFGPQNPFNDPKTEAAYE